MSNHSDRVAAAREFVRLGFGDSIDDNASFRSLEFLTDTLTTDEVVEVLPVLPSFNAFDGLKVAHAVKEFRGRVSGWQFGSANSPVLLVVLAPWTNQLEFAPRNAPGSRQFTDAERSALLKELSAVLTEQLGADSFEQRPNSQFKYAAWWD